jgi:hydroxyacyl-ACP dehydratase HTD2-like protein with hotdog domain
VLANEWHALERLVHGPLTALMLLETAVFHNPGLQLTSFEYRARNPMIVKRAMTIHGSWTDKNIIKLWCVDENGVVGMTGTVETD